MKDLALDLPPPPKSAGNYVPGVQVGNLLFLSGCGPQRADGSTIVGKVGADLDVEQAYAAARVAGLAMLARIRLVAGSLDRVARVVKVLGMVNCRAGLQRAAQGHQRLLRPHGRGLRRRAAAARAPRSAWRR